MIDQFPDWSTDPLEDAIARALDGAEIEYVRERDNPTNLDFALANGVQIEVKAWHSPRISDQMSRARNVIAIQGPGAVAFFVALLCGVPDVIKPAPPEPPPAPPRSPLRFLDLQSDDYPYRYEGPGTVPGDAGAEFGDCISRPHPPGRRTWAFASEKARDAFASARDRDPEGDETRSGSVERSEIEPGRLADAPKFPSNINPKDHNHG